MTSGSWSRPACDAQRAVDVGISTDLKVGLAQMLDDAGAVTWTPSGAVDVSATPPPIFMTIYPAKPDVAAALTTYYPGGDEPTLSGSLINLQVRTRSSREVETACDDLDDAISAHLLGHWPQVLSTGVRVTTIWRISGSPIGRDAAGRMERTTNYTVRVYDPGPYRG